MRNKFFLILLSAVSTFGLFYLFTDLAPKQDILAGSEHNLPGWAWSANIGWISFNSTNHSGTVNYGVNVRSDGLLEGFAWSDNVGWITFNSSQLGGCPSGACEARFNSLTGEITGWARAYRAIEPEGQTLGGWDGWISLRGTATDGSPYGVSATGCDWEGWAWGSDVVGWISFKGTATDGSTYGVKGSGAACANQPPSASDLSRTPGDYCESRSEHFSWTYSDPDGDDQSQFQFQVDDNSTFSSPEVNRTIPIVRPSPSTNNQAVEVRHSPGPDQIAYNATYYWRARVWDSKSAESDWAVGSFFTTPLHARPEVNFSWSPQEPSVGEETQFTDGSKCFNVAGSVVPCASWSWTFPDGDPPSSTEQNPVVKFTSRGEKTVSLTVTDSGGLSCAKTSDPFRVKLPLPEFKEIPPF